MPWRPVPLSYAIATYPFQPSDSPSELPLQVGDQLYIIEQGGLDGSWCRGYLVAPPSILSALNPGGRAAAEARVFSGIFPRCCVEIREELGEDVSARSISSASPPSKPPAPVPMLKIGDESPTSATEPLVDEIASCLREWHILHLPELLLNREYELLEKISTLSTRLDYSRRQLLNNVLTDQERRGVRSRAVWDLVRGNKMLGGEVIVRDPEKQGRLLTADDSVVELTRLQAVMSVLESAPIDKPESAILQHCLLEIKSVTGTELDNAKINIALYQKHASGHLVQFTETFSCSVSEKMKTLLSDISLRDIQSDSALYLVVKVVVQEPPKVVPKLLSERTPSRNGTVKGNSDLVGRKRSSLMFGSMRRSERHQSTQNGRMTPVRERASTPAIPEDATDETPSQPKPSPLPRLLGVGVKNITKQLKSMDRTEVSMAIWYPAQTVQEKGQEWDPLVSTFLYNPSRAYSVFDRIPQLQVVLQAFPSPDADTLIRQNVTTMHMVAKTPKLGFSETPSVPRSDIYLTLSKVLIPQGAQLSHPELGFSPVKDTALLNLQLTMEVRDFQGRRIENCIFPASNLSGVTAFRTLASELGADWDQTVCLRIPKEKVPECHLILSVAEAPGFPFALAWLPLWQDQAFLADGKHSLVLHAYDRATSSIVNGRGAYMALPWNSSSIPAGHDGVSVIVASLELETKLSSTSYSQDRTLVSLINWKQYSSFQLIPVLQKLVFVPEFEIVKQIRDVLDALFALLQHKSGDAKFEDLIFNDLVFVLGIVHDRRFNLGPIVNSYIANQFHFPFAASCLVRSFTRLLQSVADPQSARDMRALFKVGKQFMKFLMASHHQRQHLSESTTAGDSHLRFREDMQAVFFGLQMMMRSETASLVGSKTLLVQNFHAWLPELLTAYTIEEVIKIGVNIIDSSSYATGKLSLYRIILILNYIKIEALWEEDQNHEFLIRSCIRWLAPHWPVNHLTDDWREQIRLCCSVVAELSRRPSSSLHEFMPKVVSAYCQLAAQPSIKKKSISLLFPGSYPFPNKATEDEEDYDEALLELSALISTIANIPSGSPTKLHDEDLSVHVMSTLSVLRSLLNHDTCPASWLSLNICNHASSLTILSYTATILYTHYLPSLEEAETFDMELWKTYFETLLAVLASPALILESFPEQKRRAVWKISGDVRQAGADLLLQSWNSIGWEASSEEQKLYHVDRMGGYQVQYVPGLVGPVLELCLSMHEGLRKVAVGILQTMFISEWAMSEDLDLIETEMIGALNSIMKSPDARTNEVLSRKLFIGELLGMFKSISNQPENQLWAALEELVSTIEELIDLLGVSSDPSSPVTETNVREVDVQMMKTKRSIEALGMRDKVNSFSSGSRKGKERQKEKEQDREKRTATPTSNKHRDTKTLSHMQSASHINGNVAGGGSGITSTGVASSITATSQSDGKEKEYGVHALECYKTLAEEYERTGDYTRLAKTHRAMARIHEARAASRRGTRRISERVNGFAGSHSAGGDEDEFGDSLDGD